MPLPVISSLQLLRKDRVGLILVFTVGGVWVSWIYSSFIRICWHVCISVTVISTYRMTILNGALKTLDPTCEFSPVILEHPLYNIFCRMSNYWICSYSRGCDTSFIVELRRDKFSNHVCLLAYA
jgi:hypothetical protein